MSTMCRQRLSSVALLNWQTEVQATLSNKCYYKKFVQNECTFFCADILQNICFVFACLGILEISECCQLICWHGAASNLCWSHTSMMVFRTPGYTYTACHLYTLYFCSAHNYGFIETYLKYQSPGRRMHQNKRCSFCHKELCFFLEL